MENDRNHASPLETPDDGGDVAVRVLYVDRERAAVDAVDEYVDEADADVSLYGTTDHDLAEEVAESESWGCVVVGDLPDGTERAALVSDPDAATVGFANEEGSLSLADVDAAVAKDTNETGLRRLLSVIRGFAGPGGEDGVPDVGPASVDETGERTERAQLDRADAVLDGVVRDLGSASKPGELDQAVCERLVGHEPVTLAWVGQREGANRRLVPEAVAGEPRAYLRDVVASMSDDEATAGPLAEVADSGDVLVVDDLWTDDLTAWPDVARTHGVRSLATAPIRYRGTDQGVMAVYGVEVGAFDDAFADRFGLLGHLAGFARTALQNRQLVQRDETIRLVFRSQSDEAALASLARACDCRLETTGSIELESDALQFVETRGAAPAEVVGAALDRDTVKDGRVVRPFESETGGVVELRFAESFQSGFVDVGARLVRVVATPEETTVVAEVPHEGNVRTIHEKVRASNPAAELVAKTERSRTKPENRDDWPLAKVLTDRQQQVLRAAYLAGYYAWPRDTTAEELADSLGISSPTLHQHLRRAERNILSGFFEENGLDT